MSKDCFKKIIKTKYQKPRANHYLIPRQHLYKKLQKVLSRKVTLVIAPAGAGKTTAVLEWLNNQNLKVSWFSIDASDNNPITFWRYFSAALDKNVPGILQETEYVSHLKELLDANMHLSIIIEFLAKTEGDLVLVLDDIHLISNAGISEGLNVLISYLPQKVHLILIARYEPALNVPLINIKSQILKIGTKDLHFMNEEIGSFFLKRGYKLDEGEIIKIQRYTEGWAAAMVAIAMSMEEAGNKGNVIDNLLHSKSKGSIDHYLEKEVFNSWSDEKRDFALKTSIIDTLTPSLCDFITGQNNGRYMLEEINRKSGFMTAIDGEDNKYKYHHLFKDFLNNLLIDKHPDLVTELHKKAGKCYEHLGDYFQAIEHYLKGEDYNNAYRLIELQLEGLGGRNDYHLAFSWIHRLPSEYKDKSFRIAVVFALYYSEIYDFRLSREWIIKMEKLINAPHLVTIYNLIKANLFIREGKTDEFLTAIKEAGKVSKGKYYKMPKYMDINTSDIYFYRCPYNRFTYLFSQRREEFHEMVKNYRNMISENPGYAHLAAGEYYYETNQLDKSISHLSKALEEALDTDCPGSFVPTLVNIARIKRAKGDIKGAFEVLTECEEKLKDNKHHWKYMIIALKTKFYMDNDDIKNIEKWLDHSKINLFMEINRIREFELLVYARVLIFNKKYTDGELLLQRLLIFMQKINRKHSMVETLNLLSILEYQRGNTRKAIEYLNESLKIGLEEGYIRSYLDEFDGIVPLLRHYVMHSEKQKGHCVSKDFTTYAKDLLKQMQKSLVLEQAAQSSAAAEKIQKLLTNQEKTVLKLLLEAYTNKEIAQELDISIWTVKSHVGHIYDKLEVKNRVQCIKLSWEMHLFK